ncbi:hypothetical protein AC579_1983 [Pseudocercospora musae]|uniref:Uncharacterized protein n=1 Tax=Pseudocercospora musae TaxID=113226 RepID=A0A139I8K0_9PEZI|nr:hypothetical protein AC579_1983 [Pseudocercospora musae]
MPMLRPNPRPVAGSTVIRITVDALHDEGRKRVPLTEERLTASRKAILQQSDNQYRPTGPQNTSRAGVQQDLLVVVQHALKILEEILPEQIRELETWEQEAEDDAEVATHSSILLLDRSGL